ncbi:MAG: hypothetical protein GYB65_07260 [Chloroflexi bacterium]|nr:hypothetical protein [Chloroflexota bacterium]
MSVQLHQAVQLAQAGRRTEARQVLIKLVQRQPTDPVLWLWLAAVAADSNEYQQALANVLRLDPDNQQARTLLDQAARQRGSSATRVVLLAILVSLAGLLLGMLTYIAYDALVGDDANSSAYLVTPDDAPLLVEQPAEDVFVHDIVRDSVDANIPRSDGGASPSAIILAGWGNMRQPWPPAG